MNFYGYSERGMLLSLAIDLYTLRNRKEILEKILFKIDFIDAFLKFPDFDDFDIYFEQSFSDFGDSDLFIILKNANQTVCNIFIEAKVNSWLSSKWKSERELIEFQNFSTEQLNSSNLFTQLYHKMVLMKTINEDKHFMAKLKMGVEVRSDSKKQTRKIGNIQLIHKIVLEEIAKGEGLTYYIGLIPKNDFKKSDFNYKDDFWSLHNLGFLTYKSIKNILEKEVKKDSVFLVNFERNKDRIVVIE